MIFPNIFGSYDTRDLTRLTANDAPGGQAQVMADLRAFADTFNRAVEMYQGILSRLTTESEGTFASGGGGGEMQPYSEYGETEATRADELEWAWAAGIWRFRDRQLYTEEYLATNTLDQLGKDTIAATIRNYTTRIKMIIRALTTNTSYVFREKQFPGDGRNVSHTVYPLFNADSRAGRLIVNGNYVSVGSLQSFLPSGSGTLVKGQFTLGRTALAARGLTGRVAHVISPDDVSAVRAMADFTPRATPNPYLTVQDPTAVVETPILTEPESIGVFSDNGATDGEVIVFPFWPSGYTFHFDRTQPPPLVVRQHALAQFQGFRLVQDQTRTAYGEQSLANRRWEYIAGTGVENQGNGISIRAHITTYTPPTV